MKKQRVLEKLFIAMIALAFLLPASASRAAEIDDQLSLDKIEDVQFLDAVEKAQKGADGFSEFPEYIGPDHWAYQSVKYLVDAGLLEDTPGHAFQFGKQVTKQELIKLLKKVRDKKSLAFNAPDAKIEKELENNKPGLPYKKPTEIEMENKLVEPPIDTKTIEPPGLINRKAAPAKDSSTKGISPPAKMLTLKRVKKLAEKKSEMPLNINAQYYPITTSAPEQGPLSIYMPPIKEPPAVMPLDQLLGGQSGATAPRPAQPAAQPAPAPEAPAAIIETKPEARLDFDFPAPTPAYTPPPPVQGSSLPVPDTTPDYRYVPPPAKKTTAVYSSPAPRPAMRIPSPPVTPPVPTHGPDLKKSISTSPEAPYKEKKDDDLPPSGQTSSPPAGEEKKSEAKKTDSKTSEKSTDKTDSKTTDKKSDKTAKSKDTGAKEEAKKDDKAAKDKTAAKPPKIPKEFEKLGKKVELDEKDAEMLSAIVDYVEKDVVKKTVKAQIGDVAKIAQRNEREIEKLQQEHQRYKVTGSGEVGYQSTNYLNSSTSVGEWQSVGMSLYSKPRKFDDMILRTNVYDPSGSLNIQYQNFNADKKNPKNFKLRSLYAGNIGYGASPLTVFGTDMKGFFTETNLNDYSFKFVTGHRNGDSRSSINAMSLQFKLFNESGSWIYLSRINNTYESAYATSRWGQWTNGYGTLQKPGYKNAVNSVYVRYPMPVKGVYFTGEYAHSTYYRPGFKMGFPNKSGLGDYSTWDSFWDNYDFNWSNAYLGWIPIPELRDQDDAFVILLDYNSGPLTIFPLAYIRLGPQFVSKNLGLPGLDTSSLNLSMIPINLQSLEAALIRGNFKKTEDNYSIDFMAARVNETGPMFLDTSSFGSDMDILMKLNLLARLNNRSPASVLGVNLAQSKLSYYLTDKITLSGDFMKVVALLPPSCIDGNITYIKDDMNNTVNAYIGNGTTDCQNDKDDLMISLRYATITQKYNLYWRTSKKSEFSMDYNISDSAMKAQSSVEPIESAVDSLVDQGKKYSLNSRINYRLTDVSNVEMWYNKSFGRPDISRALPGSDLTSTVGMKLSMGF